VDITVIHDGFNVDGSLGVGRENLLATLSSDTKTQQTLLVGKDINLELLLELGSELIDNDGIKVTTTKVLVVGVTADSQLSLEERDDGDRVRGVTDIDESDVLGLVLRQIELGDTVTKGSGSQVVDKTQAVQANHLGGIKNSATLNFGEPTGDGDDTVGNGALDFSGSDILDLVKIHGEELDVGEKGLLTEVVDL
jgi:hypothetical protein